MSLGGLPCHYQPKEVSQTLVQILLRTVMAIHRPQKSLSQKLQKTVMKENTSREWKKGKGYCPLQQYGTLEIFSQRDFRIAMDQRLPLCHILPLSEQEYLCLYCDPLVTSCKMHVCGIHNLSCDCVSPNLMEPHLGQIERLLYVILCHSEILN